MTSVIEVQHVWKQYEMGLRHQRLADVIATALKGCFGRNRSPGCHGGEFWALKDVDFSVEGGETFGIIGPNGAGKSTILKLLSDITRPTKGRIRVTGRLAPLIEAAAGFHPDLTGRENLFLLGTILGLKRQEIRALFDRMVEFAEIGPFLDTPVKRYSTGMAMRLGFAIVTHVRPEILLVDEVLSVGDLAFQQKCLERLYELKREGTTIVFVSHRLNAIQRICNRAILLERGEVIKEGKVEAIIRASHEQTVAWAQERFVSLCSQGDANEAACREVRIETVRLCDQRGQSVDTIEMGQPLTVEVGYAGTRRIEHPTVKIGIERFDGLVCHVTSMQDDGTVVPALEGHGVLQLHYHAMNLLPNAYWVSVEIGEQGHPVPLDSHKPGSFLAVRSDGREGGTLHLEHRWRWDTNSQPPVAAGPTDTDLLPPPDGDLPAINGTASCDGRDCVGGTPS